MKHIIMSETFIKIDSLQHLEILAHEPTKKSALQHSLFDVMPIFPL